MKIGVIGMGIVGGATAKVLSKAHTIYPYDKYKPEYQDIELLVRTAEAVFICVPTPMKSSGEIDYSAIHNSLAFLLENAKKVNRNLQDILVVLKSTAVSGTTDKLADTFPFRFAFNPEFLREKYALEDMENTDRIILGTADEKDKEKLLNIYKPLFPNAKYILTDRKTAEMIKYAANTFLASQIAIANEIYGICHALNIDYEVVKDAILLDERIARNINVPGSDRDFGFGGKCFPKDLNALIYLARENWYRPYLLEEVWRLNERVRKNKDWFDIPGAVSNKQTGSKK